jgi:hypothetical protein
VKPTGGHSGFGEGDTEIFFRGFRFTVGFGFTVALVDVIAVALPDGLTDGLTDGFTETFAVGLALGFTVALTVGDGVGFLVAATAELPESANASARTRESFLNRVPT